VGLFIVSDGMGGEAAGEIASDITVQTLRTRLVPELVAWADKPPSDQDRLVPEAVAAATREAHAAVGRYASEHPEKRGLGCTVDAVVVLGSQVYIGHVGDSRVGLVRSAGLRWLTEDQTLVGRLLKLGIIDAQEAETHPDRSKILQAIGSSKQVDPAHYQTVLQPGDRLLCCSDGLTGHVDDQRIGEIMLASPDPQTACHRLINEANVNGGTDNTTVIVLHVT
jgi:protein phosphatase